MADRAFAGLALMSHGVRQGTSPGRAALFFLCHWSSLPTKT